MPERIVALIDRITDYIIILFGILIFLVGGYGIYDSYLVYSDATDESLLRVREYFEDSPEEVGELLDSCVGWVTLDGTTVDYPVMQGKDNNEFLNKDPYGNYSLPGSIFLDYRNAPDYSDEYNLIYGHHMTGGIMFGALDAYLEEGYLEDHSTGTVITKDGTKYRLKLYAVVDTDATDEVIFEPGFVETREVLEHMRENALYYNREADSGSDGRVLALSTCRYPDTAERTVVVGHLFPHKP